eukprot:gnl/TRDRNA2_/TRDRNA2_165902_c1_seq3.p2 gnl/TRDRNA2_/TRDRNA2_165902_c1~~gnl/TRDRNA2_/TRDRNA2_165902_c1_seq3.p2  ORF type:complete len:119 (-),score=18.63 gnl/TRDRNA2_/TRDRNA2_165902_c1_seq3:135-491(-)
MDYDEMQQTDNGTWICYISRPQDAKDLAFQILKDCSWQERIYQDPATGETCGPDAAGHGKDFHLPPINGSWYELSVSFINGQALVKCGEDGGSGCLLLGRKTVASNSRCNPGFVNVRC